MIPPRSLDRRAFLRQTLGGSLLVPALAPGATPLAKLLGGAAPGLHHAAKAKRVIYLFQSGGPSQLETFDYKPLLNERNGEQLPDSVRQGQRLTGMSGNQTSLPLAGAQFSFAQHGESGAWVSELLPHTAKIVDKLCIVRSMYTEAINHDPAITFFLTGSQIAGRPSMGAWLAYALGSMTQDLPSFIVLVTQGKGGQPLYARLWGAGFLPARYQGVQLRAGTDPVLYLENVPGIDRARRRRMLDAQAALQGGAADAESIQAQQELAFRMQESVPEVADLSDEPEETFALYGEDARKPGTYAANALMARRLLERGVRFVQLFHQGWDQHGGLPGGIRTQCRETDQASAALVQDLERRGMLDDTLVVWGGEFGRTNYSQGKLTANNYGRDHHPRCFSMWMAGGGVRPGTIYGETDPFGYNITANPVHVHDLNATLLHLLGIDHERLTWKYQGRRFRLTDVHGEVVRPLLA
ncbi:MAG: sulfatase [Planctomycetes bacterium]|nr:sulfatase [Planctomycetota bacterium]